MNKRKKSLIKSERESTTLPQSSIRHSYSPEIWTQMRMSEAREWLMRYRQKVKTDGQMQARGWWEGVISDIEKIRGKKATTELLYWMSKEK